MLLLGSLAISTGYGTLLLLPLYVVELGGNEADFGLIVANDGRRRSVTSTGWCPGLRHHPNPT